jgi:type IV secretory pathway VirB3-like protein
MQDLYDQLRDPIFKGCTRPALLLGVPLIPCIITVGVLFLLGMWLVQLASLLWGLAVLMSIIPVVITLRAITKQDDQRLNQLFIWAMLRLGNRSQPFWGAVSYAPKRYKSR